MTKSMRGRTLVRRVAAGAAILLGASLAPAPPAASAQVAPTCVADVPGGPVIVTADCVDPLYSLPVIDSEVDVTTPVAYHRVSGHFEGTTKRFTFYFPPKSQWDGRFFHSVYPLTDEIAVDDTIAFGADSGAYTVQTNSGGGFRVDAAAAKFSKTVAADYYDEPTRRIYGYIYGGSGGSFQAISAIENSRGVWDGAVPFVVGVPTSIPNNFFVRAFARFVLEAKAPQIADAVSPGGSGDPFAGLNELERSVLLEVTRLGVPLRMWEDYRYVLGLDTSDGLLGFGAVIRDIDPTYANDFWTKPGYAGTEQSALGDLFRAARTGDMDTDWSLALLTYHRHQVPAASEGFYPWDQFRQPNGDPIYPQRPLQIGPLISGSITDGGTFTGQIHGKVIVVDNLLDTDAFPWQADWYARRVEDALGKRADESFRVWFNDNADHIGARTPRLVDYNGILQQALRDVSAWAEQGIAPPGSTRYDVDDNSQVNVPANAAARRGIQPVVDLTVTGRGDDRVDITAGQSVTFKATIHVPPNTGKVVGIEWDSTGAGSFVAAPLAKPKPVVEVKATFTYATPGTYYVAARATSQRDGDPNTPYGRVQNLDRVRVVVH